MSLRILTDNSSEPVAVLSLWLLIILITLCVVIFSLKTLLKYLLVESPTKN